MKKSSTRLKELIYTSLECSETSDENNNLALSKKEKEPKKEILDNIVAYAASVKAVKTSSCKEILITLN